MPLYDYKCQKCGHRFEKIQKFSDPPVKRCPECGGKVEKLISAPAVQFKGSGWYVTDYPKKSAQPPGSSKTSDDGQASSSSDSTSESKDSKSKAKTDSPDKKHKK